MVLSSSSVAIPWTSEFAPASSKEFLNIQATIECGFTLKHVHDMTRTYSLEGVLVKIWSILVEVLQVTEVGDWIISFKPCIVQNWW